ncbi:hypothetical protein Tco_0616705, partial [Tanacetum coccineum]
MERWLGSNFVKLACFIVHHDAHTAAFAITVLIALIIIAHGLDNVSVRYDPLYYYSISSLPDVAHVINYDMPGNIEQ